MIQEDKLEEAKRLYETANADQKHILERLFPELKESEDERIRKDVISFVEQAIDAGYGIISKERKEKWIAWLEKKGEQKIPTEGEFPYNNPADTLDGEIENIWEKLSCDNKFTATKDGFHEVVVHFVNWYEKQGEQKTTDKAEPKFEVGDWIVNTITGNVEQIIEITSNEYVCSGTLIVSFDNQHLLKKWTIEDAKDGDVLSFNNGHGIDCIELIKSITGKKIEFWFCLTNGNSYEVFDGITPYTNLASREDATPATKEQRDTLIKAMADAGYTFDFEKKELKRIGHKLADKIEPKFRVKYADSEYNVLEVKDIDGVTFYGIEDEPNHIDYVQAKNCARVDKIEQNPAWSKKDDRILDEIIEEIEANKSNAPDYDIPAYDRFLSFLKSLKERVGCELNCTTTKSGAYRWKPTEKQIMALRWVLNNVPYNRYKEEISGLLDQIKEL